MKHTPKTDMITQAGLDSGQNIPLLLDLYGLSKTLEHALRQVVDTAAFHDMPDEVIEAVNKALEIETETH